MKTVETRVIDTLKPHPRNAALYGNEAGLYDDKLVVSLKAGIWPGEIQVTTTNVIISGHRRCDHAIFAEIEEAEVWVRHDLPEDPNSPEVLEALLQGNLQRNKTKEHQLREFELWLEVEKEQAKGRIGGDRRSDQGGEIHHDGRTGKARDLAAERVGFKSGSDAEKALKALKAADAAEATGDAEQIEKAKLVKQELNKSLGGAVRVAREQGLTAAPKPKTAKSKTKPEAIQAGQPVMPPPINTPTGQLPELSVKLIAEEKKLAAKRAAALANLADISALMLKALKTAQNHYEKNGRSVLREFKKLADEQLVGGVLAEQCQVLGLPADATYEQLVRKVDAVAKSVAQSARGLLYLYGYTEFMED